MTRLIPWSRQNALAVLLLGIMLALLISSSFHKPFAFDEYGNLYYGMRFLTEGPLTPPDGQQMPVLALNAFLAFAAHNDLTDIQADEFLRLLARFPTMIFALLLGLLIYRWSRELFGKKGAILSLALYALNPNFIAHGKQLTGDVQTTFFMLAGLYSFWHFMKSFSRKDLLFCILFTACSLVTKYTGILLFPVYGILLAAKGALLWKRQELHARLLGKTFIGGILSGIAILFLLNAAYLFQGSFLKPAEYSWKSRAFERFKAIPVPIPLPKVYTLGLDYSSYIQEHPEIGRGSNYILGKLHRKGRWFAFPIMILLKTPLAFFLILLLAGSSRRKIPGYGWYDSLFLWVPFAFLLFFFSVLVHAQLGIRYVLPAFVFLIVYAGKCFAAEPPKWKAALTSVLLGWYFLSTLLYHPHYMPYFNELIGRRENAYRYLADSNLEWEDNDYFIREYLEKHPSLRIAFEPKEPKSGYLLVGANRLTGVYDEDQFRWLRANFRPVGQVAYSHFLFYVPDEKLKAILSGKQAPS